MVGRAGGRDVPNGVHLGGAHAGGRQQQRPANTHTLPAIKNRSSPEGKRGMAGGGGIHHHTSPTRHKHSSTHTDWRGGRAQSLDSRVIEHRAVVPFHDGLDDGEMDVINRSRAADLEILSSIAPKEDEDIENSRAEFVDWLEGYDDIQFQFSSTMVCAEMKFQELQQRTLGLKSPNTLMTAGCGVLLDRLSSSFTKDTLLSKIAAEILMSLYKEWKPETLIRSGFFDKVPYFVLADELERNNEKLKVQVQELLDIQAEAAASSKVIKSVAQRELERMMWMFKKMYLQAWVTYLNDKKSILARLRQRFSDGYVRQLMLQIFRGWKAETLAEVIWRQTKEIAYFEEQVAFFSKEDPEKAKAAREHASLTLSEEEMSPELAHEKDGEDAGSGLQTRPPTTEERVIELYNTSTSAKPMALNLCVEAIGELITLKIAQDKEHVERNKELQSMPFFCRDYFLSRLGTNGPARKRLHEFISGLRTHARVSPLCKFFGRIVFAFHEAGDASEIIDEHESSFALCAIKAAVPPGMVQSRLLSNYPTMLLSDCKAASLVAFRSQWGLGDPNSDAWERMEALTAEGLLESDMMGDDQSKGGGSRKGMAREDSKTLSVQLYSWLGVLLDVRAEQLKICRDQTVSAMENLQRLTPKNERAVSLVRFREMMKDMKADLPEYEITEIYNEVSDLTGRHQDRFSSYVFFEVCRKHKILYLGPA